MHQVTQDTYSLYTDTGDRKYINQLERRRVLETIQRLTRDRALFTALLAWTGARVSEMLLVRPVDFQLHCNVVALRTLKRRKFHVREVPIPPAVMAELDAHYHLEQLRENVQTAYQRLWPWSRVTAWRFVRRGMLEAGIVGRRACPRGLRHGFGTGTLQASVPLNIIQKWMGHSRPGSTAIYASVCGPEEIAFAARFWDAD